MPVWSARMDADSKARKSKKNFEVSMVNNSLGGSTGLLIQTVP
jgi:hypothetical protein